MRALKPKFRIFPLSRGLALIVGLGLSMLDVEASSRQMVTQTCGTQKVRGNVREANCTGAKDTYRARQSNFATSAVWSGAAIVCAKACLNRMASPLCTYSAPAASASEGIITKNYISALQPVAGQAAGQADLKVQAATQLTGETTAKQAAGAAEPCQTAASSAFSATRQFTSATKNGERLTQIRDNTQKLDSLSGGASITVGGADSAALRAGDSLIPGAPECEEQNLVSAAAYLRCAYKTQPQLPPELASEEFLKQLQKATGKSADQFFKDYQNPASAILGSLPGGLSADRQRALAATLGQMNRSAGSRSGEDGAVAVMSEGRGSSSEEGDPDLNSLLAQALGQLGPEESAEPENPSSVGTEEFRALRAPSGEISPEDRNFSLFERVKLRYSHVNRKLHLEER